MGAWTWVTIYILIGLATGGIIHLTMFLLADKANDDEKREEIQRKVEEVNRELKAGNITTPTFYVFFSLLWPAFYVLLIRRR